LGWGRKSEAGWETGDGDWGLQKEERKEGERQRREVKGYERRKGMRRGTVVYGVGRWEVKREGLKWRGKVKSGKGRWEV
jgi:hypothetical protein